MIENILNLDGLYYSPSIYLHHSQKKLNESPPFESEFMWNSYIASPFISQSVST